MRAYEVEMIRDGKVKYFFIRNMETMEIELLPTRFLTHKTRAQESPNTVGSLARSICYYMNFCDGRQMGFTDVCQMDYEAQFNHFTDFLQWLKAGNHTKNLKKTPRNRTCNTYLKNVFGFFSFLEMAEDQFGPLQVLSYGTIHVANSVGVKRRLRFRSFAGYLKEEEREVRAAEKNEIVSILEACTNCRDQLLILMASELGFRIGDDDDKIRLNQRKPSKYKGLSRFGPEKNLQRINKFMKERPTFYKKLIQMKENFRFYLRCFYCITKVVILQFNSEKQDRISS